MKSETDFLRDKIAELEAENQKLSLDYISAVGQAQMHLEALKELREAVRDAVDDDFMTNKYMIRLAELMEADNE